MGPLPLLLALLVASRVSASAALPDPPPGIVDDPPFFQLRGQKRALGFFVIHSLNQQPEAPNEPPQASGRPLAQPLRWG
uniref:Secreted protein n=1 Tax=Ixodes ricinus TaxID=34613 RepID=A0A147BV72_IXORI